MKILILVDALHSIAAGSERQIYKLAAGLVDAGHQVTLTLLRHTTFTQTLTNFPCAIECLNISSIASPAAAVKLLRFKQKLITNQTEVVHAWLPDSCLLAPLYLKHRNLKIFTSRRDMGLIYQGKPAWLYGLMRNRTDCVISNSKAVSELVATKEKLPANRTRVIYNGLESYSAPQVPKAPLFTQQNSLKCILVANIKPVKRTHDAVAAVIQLNQQGLKTELALIGEQQDLSYCNRVNQQIIDAGMQSLIHWAGSLVEPRAYLDQADIGLLVSDSEGLSNTLMEYMQAGLASIATRVGGNPELIFNEQTGLLVERGDVAGIAKAISTLNQSADKRHQLGAAARALIAKEFSIAHMVKQHEKLYEGNHQSQREAQAPC